MRLDFQTLPVQELYRMCLQGHEDAWNYLYQYVLSICRWPKWTLRDSPEDMAQGIIAHLLEKGIDDVRNINAFLAFVKRTAINQILDSFKSPRPPLTSMDQPLSDGKGGEFYEEYPDPDSSIEQETKLREMTRIIDQCLEAIPEYCRGVLTAYFQMKLGIYQDYKELSRVLRRPVGTISAQVRRCLNAFTKIRQIRELL